MVLVLLIVALVAVVLAGRKRLNDAWWRSWIGVAVVALALAVVFGLSGCGTSGAEKVATTDWTASGGQAAMDGLSSALTAITASTKPGGPPLAQSCTQLLDAVGQARTVGPPPAGADEWNAALDAFGAAADACLAGDLAVVGPTLIEASDHLDAAADQF